MESFRLPRFTRADTVAAMHLTDRDRKIIRLVHRHRFLRSSHICSLAPGSSQQILRRLQLLYHHGFLERPRSQLDYYHRDGSRGMVYGLGNRSTSLLKAEFGTEFREPRRDERNGSVKRIFLEHELLVSDVMVAVELACRQNGIGFLSEQDLEVAGRPFEWQVNVAGRKISVVPDRVFALQSGNEAGETSRAYFFLEADRGTMPVIRKNPDQTSFHRKLVGYEATWLQSIHEKHFGFRRFRVLTVTTNAARVKSLVAACSKLKSGHGLFLFADRTILDKLGGIFSATWQTGRGGSAEKMYP